LITLYVVIMQILLAEDDAVLSDGISKALKQRGYSVAVCNDGLNAQKVALANNFDLLILDLGLPTLDGLNVLQSVRSQNKVVPILIVTARDGLNDRVHGLDLGADDYITKPFDLPELEARVRALLRRSNQAKDEELILGELKFDVPGRRAFVNGLPLELSAKEVAVLEFLMLRAGKVVNKEQLIEHMYGWDEDVTYNAIEVNIHRLRKKLEAAKVNIRTIRGLGYLLDTIT
jgi:two-component system OmpR family response regulator